MSHKLRVSSGLGINVRLAPHLCFRLYEIGSKPTNPCNIWSAFWIGGRLELQALHFCCILRHLDLRESGH